MKRISDKPATSARVSAEGQTVIPRAVREHLKLKSGDTLRYRSIEDAFLLDKAPDAGPFAVFTEWKSEADEKAYNEL